VSGGASVAILALSIALFFVLRARPVGVRADRLRPALRILGYAAVAASIVAFAAFDPDQTRFALGLPLIGGIGTLGSLGLERLYLALVKRERTP
jgi:hypothetical protein